MSEKKRFSIWIGDGKNADAVEIIRLNNPNTGADKFDTCVHRGPQETRTKRSCCGQVNQTGFICNKLNLFPLVALSCASCSEYQAKTS